MINWNFIHVGKLATLTRYFGVKGFGTKLNSEVIVVLTCRALHEAFAKESSEYTLHVLSSYRITVR